MSLEPSSMPVRNPLLETAAQYSEEELVDKAVFQSEFYRMSQANGIFLVSKFDAIFKLVNGHEEDAIFCNIFRGKPKDGYLLVTTGASYSIRAKLFGVRCDWIVDHTDLIANVWHRRGLAGKYIVDQVVLSHRNGTASFQMGFNDPGGTAGTMREIAKVNCETAVLQINDARSAQDSATPPGQMIVFDAKGPEKAGADAKEAYDCGHFLKAFQISVIAVDRLHDFYVFERFRNRQPAISDSWIVNGLIEALAAARARDKRADVVEGVRTATHRLRDIVMAINQAGGNPTLYMIALNELAELAADVDVSDIY